MSSYLPTLKQLQYLVALKEQGHFGKAAEACFVTQSTLSAGIRELESLIGVTLVERTRRVVRFTALGDRIVEKAHRVLREAEELAAIAEASGKPLTGELRMSVIPTIAPFLLPRLLPRLRADRPELKLYLREETSQAAIESLRHGNVDCVLLALPFPTGELDSEILFEDRLYFGCEADDRLNAIAFDTRLNHMGARLQATFGSDIGHWDVLDSLRVVNEAYELVEAGLMSGDDFRDFTFTNNVTLHAGVNPDFFKGTAIEAEAAQAMAKVNAAAE